MELVPNVVNYGDAPLFSVDGISSVEFISANKLRVSYFIAHRTANGDFDRRVILCIDWDADVWANTWPICKDVDRMVCGRAREITVPRHLGN